LLITGVALLVCAAPASGADPGRWRNTGVSRIPIAYYQGVASDPAHNFYFDGVYSGLYRTDPALRQTAAKPEPAGVIPPAVRAGEQYDHIGDIAYDGGEGGRIVLPLECYYPGSPGDANTCQNGAFGVADPATLAWRYYVKLDPVGIKKAMWVEPSPDGTLLWTSDGDDLVAYDASQVKPANAATRVRAFGRLGSRSVDVADEAAVGETARCGDSCRSHADRTGVALSWPRTGWVGATAGVRTPREHGV
jgi:hypothetical protein